MNTKGAAMLGILFAIAFFMFGMIMYQFLKPVISEQRDADHMKCATPDTNGDKVICLILDGIIPIVILTILSAVAGSIFAEVLK